MDILNSYQKRLINLIIFEHACKHNMQSLIKNVVQDEELMHFLLADLTSSNKKCPVITDCKIRPAFFFVLILKNFLYSLENSLAKDISDMLLWNKKSLDQVLELLSSAYQQHTFLSFKSFTTLISQLKLMDLVRLLAEGVPGKLIVQSLNIFFPRWTQRYKVTVEKNFSVKDPKKIEKIEESHNQCRRLILRFAASDSCRADYLAHKASSEMRTFITNSIFLLKKALRAIEKNIGPTEIEKLIYESEKNLSQPDDPAIQILLEYLKPNMSEKDFLKLIHALEPSFSSRMDIGFSTCLQPFDILSDTCSMISEQSYISDDQNMDRSSDDEDSQKNSLLEQPLHMLTSENLQKCLEKQSALNVPRKNASCSTPIEATEDADNTLKFDEPSSEIIADSEEEIFANSCQSSESQYPDIQVFLINVNVKPCIIKLYHNQVICIGSKEHEIYS